MPLKVEYKPEYATMLIEHLKTGSFPSFSGVIYVSEGTLWMWVRSYPDFVAAKVTQIKKKTTSVYTGVLGADRVIKYYKRGKHASKVSSKTQQLPIGTGAQSLPGSHQGHDQCTAI